MNRRAWWILAAAMWPLHATWAQDITGTWQGTIQPPQAEAQRLKFKISRGEGGEMTAILYPVAANAARPIPGNRVTLDGHTITILLLPQGQNFVGELSEDGDSIDGGIVPPGGFGIPIPLNVTRVTAGNEWARKLSPAPRPMAADADPQFAAATIAAAGKKTPGFAMGTLHEFNAAGVSLVDLIRWAYEVNNRQIEGGPDWIRTDAFALNGKPEGEGEPSLAQWRTMVRKLLAERFGLALHVERRELPVYTLGIAESGSKLMPTDDPTAAPYVPFPPGVWTTMNTSVSEMASMLTVLAFDRPVLDRTALDGSFDFALIWKPEPSRFMSDTIRADTWNRLPPITADAADLVTAMREQLGLDFQSTNAPVDVLVIDNVQRPSNE